MSDILLGSIMSSVGFISIAIILWGLIIATCVFLVFGFVRKSWKALLYSGISFIIPGIVLFTQGGPFRLLLLYPVIAIIFAFVLKRRG
ncbi:hypothetical protein [Mesobacillus maritimus]|uniref:Uncharacterized protein n=1 Tax=Mesobacillus maritimus TaxID=1643336 RepID=A0ABS7K1T9_9BACI|nr:hypothetical protein [Mesobacillus maritimus]MBY0096223.1 hypothetical protein [Mesobacillus maritimus]